MIGDRVKWGQPDPEGVHAHRGGVVRTVALANGHWHVLVQRADGTYGDELAANLVAVETGAPSDVLERELAEVQAEHIAEREQIIHLRDYIIQAGLEEAGAPSLDDPCGTAIDLLKTFQAELVTVGAARDAAIAEATATRADRDAAIKRADELTVELESVKRPKPGGRNRPPERIG